MFTEGCMVLIEGEYTIEETVRVLAMGHPPSEKRDIARSATPLSVAPRDLLTLQVITWSCRFPRYRCGIPERRGQSTTRNALRVEHQGTNHSV